MIHLTSSVHCIFSRGHAKLKLLVSHTFSLPSLVRTTFLDQLYSINTEHIRRSLISPPTNAKRVAKTHDCACPLESQTRTSKGIAAETKNGLKHKERLEPKEIWLKSHRCVNHVVMMRWCSLLSPDAEPLHPFLTAQTPNSNPIEGKRSADRPLYCARQEKPL